MMIIIYLHNLYIFIWILDNYINTYRTMGGFNKQHIDDIFLIFFAENRI